MQKKLSNLLITALISVSVNGAFGAPKESIHDFVDKAYNEFSSGTDLAKGRKADQLTMDRRQNFGGVDQCRMVDGLKVRQQKSFGDAIEGAVRIGMRARKHQFHPEVNKGYKLPTEIEKISSVGLLSRPFCEVTKESVSHLLGAEFVPAETTMAQLKKFVKDLNEARAKYIFEVSKAKKENRKVNETIENKVVSLFSSLMGCIGYEEALADPGDSGERKQKIDASFLEFLKEFPTISKNFEILKRNEDTNQEEVVVERPSGVIAYIDRNGGYAIEIRKLRAQIEELKKKGKYTPKEEANYQAEVEKLKKKYPSWNVLGIFQFMPDGHGNISTCIDQWNAIYPKCAINKNSKPAVSVALLSPAQTFNSFCGVEKIVHSFHSQIHTSSELGTDLSNRVKVNGEITNELKDPSERCVSIVSRGGTGRIYSHFGPLRNSVKDNLGHVMKCVDRANKLFSGK